MNNKALSYTVVFLAGRFVIRAASPAAYKQARKVAAQLLLPTDIYISAR